jgi:RNA polymerase sigma factor (sigma-70 family)
MLTIRDTISIVEPGSQVTDTARLEAYRLRKDRHAFEALVESHRHSVFDLALRILHDDSLADDVAQETFLKLYNKPPACASDASVRSWILQVARRAAFRRRRKEGRRVLRESHYMLNRTKSATAGAVESAELQQALDALPEEFQLPVALRYLHGLTPPDVAAVLNIPVGTVGSRIARGLERLRGLLEGHRGTAQTSGAVIALGALEAGLKSLPLTRAPRSSIETLHQIANIKSASKVFYRVPRLSPSTHGPGIFAVIALGATGLWFANKRPAAPEPKVAAPLQSKVIKKVEEVKPEAVVSTEPRLYARWTFENGPPRDLKVMAGSWDWIPGDNETRGAMATPLRQNPDDVTALILPLKIPRQPLVVVIDGRILPQSELGSYGAKWTDGQKEIKPVRRYGFTDNGLPAGKVEIYFIDQYSLMVYRGSLMGINEYAVPYPNDKICVTLRNMIFDAIEVRGLRNDEIPEEFRDPRQLISQ